jgi:hypothetical protein
VSGCTRALEEGMMSPLNGLERPMISWNEHMAKLQVKSCMFWYHYSMHEFYFIFSYALYVFTL